MVVELLIAMVIAVASTNVNIAIDDSRGMARKQEFIPIKEKVNESTLSVKDFGAKGDGITDDSIAIKVAIESLPKDGGTLLFPPGTYLHGDGNNTSDIAFYFEGYKDLKIIGYGATVKSNPGNRCDYKNRVFHFRRCNDISIEGITVDGSIRDRKPRPEDSILNNTQNNFTFTGCKRMEIRNVTSINSVMDGFIITSDYYNGEHIWSEGINFRNCTGNYNYRQGLSVVDGKSIGVYDSEFSYTGTIYGTEPMSGIDFENGEYSIYGRGQSECIVQNCRFIGNVGMGVYFNFGTNNSTLKDCYFEDTGFMSQHDLSHEDKFEGYNTIESNTFKNCLVILIMRNDMFRNNRFVVDDFTRDIKSIHAAPQKGINQIKNNYIDVQINDGNIEQFKTKTTTPGRLVIACGDNADKLIFTGNVFNNVVTGTDRVPVFYKAGGLSGLEFTENKFIVDLGYGDLFETIGIISGLWDEKEFINRYDIYEGNYFNYRDKYTFGRNFYHPLFNITPSVE